MFPQTSIITPDNPLESYRDMDEYAEKLFMDFMPEALQVPQPIDIDRFLEDYFGLSVEYHVIGYDRPILGLTAFADSKVLVLDSDTKQPKEIPVSAGTVILDARLKQKRSEPRRRFTCSHEAVHWVLYKSASVTKNPALGFRESAVGGLAAKEGRIDYNRNARVKTEKERFERQVDYLSASILMPKPTPGKTYRRYFNDIGAAPRRLYLANPADCELAAKVSRHVAHTFNVSKRAAQIRLEKLDAIYLKNTKHIP